MVQFDLRLHINTTNFGTFRIHIHSPCILDRENKFPLKHLNQNARKLASTPLHNFTKKNITNFFGREKKLFILEHLNPVVFPVTHNNVTVTKDTNSLQTTELSALAAIATKHTIEPPVAMEHLDTVVPAVRHNDEPLTIYRNAFWEFHLSLE